MAKGLTISVYRNAQFGDCTNGGASSRVSEFTLVDSSIPEISEVSENAPEIRRIEHPTIKGYYYLMPAELIESRK